MRETGSESSKQKQNRDAINLKVTAARQLKALPPSKTFDKKEALQFVVELLKQVDSKGQHSLIQFDAWFR